MSGVRIFCCLFLLLALGAAPAPAQSKEEQFWEGMEEVGRRWAEVEALAGPGDLLWMGQ